MRPPDLSAALPPVFAAISAALRAAPPRRGGLMVGWPGPALLAQALGEPADELVPAPSPEHIPDLTLCLGEPGDTWARARLGRAGGEERAALVDGYCARLIRHRIARPDPRRCPPCDLLYGSVGMGLVSLTRGAAGAATVQAVVDHLAAEAVPCGHGRAWFTRPESLDSEGLALHPQGYVDLGLAHGLAGAVAFLGRAVRAGASGAGPLLDDAVEALRTFLVTDGAERRAPGLLVPDQGPSRGHTGWCRGDSGTALALLTAGLAARRPPLVALAVDLATSTARRGPELAPRPDACLCHGGAGLAWIFSTFHRATGEARFARAAEDWVRWTLSWRGTRGADIAGFPFRSRLGGDLDAWTPEAGLLNGASGVGLCLLAATSATSPAWEALLGGPGPELLP